MQIAVLLGRESHLNHIKERVISNSSEVDNQSANESKEVIERRRAFQTPWSSKESVSSSHSFVSSKFTISDKILARALPRFILKHIKACSRKRPILKGQTAK